MKLAHAQGARPVTPALPPVRRRVDIQWTPAPAGSYRLPRTIEAQLVSALAGYRNRDAALTLAVYIAKIWTIPRLLGLPFPIDRRAMADRSAVDLTEARVRGALRVLEEVVFIEREAIERGSRYRPTEHGLHRKPVFWRFTKAFLAIFAQANARAAAKRAANPATGRPTSVRQPLQAPVEVAQKESPIGKVLMGDQHLRPARADANPGLEAALGRLLAGLSGEVNRHGRA